MTGRQLQDLLARVRRDLGLARVLGVLLIVAGGFAVLGGWSYVLPGGSDQADLLVLLTVAGVWMMMTLSGAASLRLVNAAAAHLADGRLDLAEGALLAGATKFNIISTPCLLAMQNLAALAHGAGRFDQSAAISRFLLERPGRAAKRLQLRNRLLLADSELMRGDLQQAYVQLEVLYASKLPLTAQLALLPTACYYEVAVGAWEWLALGAKAREQLARLLPAPQSALTLACLALGCHRQGRPGQRDWLFKQATLLVDREALVERLPLLAALPAEAAMILPWRQSGGDLGETR
jgi:hypothetical protein